MANYGAGLLDGKKGYKPPYPGHEAMCKSTGSPAKNNSSSMVGKKKVTEGKRIVVLEQNKSSKKKGDKTQAGKVKYASKKAE